MAEMDIGKDLQRAFDDGYTQAIADIKLAHKPKTNADRIRAMSDEELAMFFDSTCTENMGSVRCDIGLRCYDCWLDWLKQEAEL